MCYMTHMFCKTLKAVIRFSAHPQLVNSIYLIWTSSFGEACEFELISSFTINLTESWWKTLLGQGKLKTLRRRQWCCKGNLTVPHVPRIIMWYGSYWYTCAVKKLFQRYQKAHAFLPWSKKEIKKGDLTKRKFILVLLLSIPISINNSLGK